MGRSPLNGDVFASKPKHHLSIVLDGDTNAGIITFHFAAFADNLIPGAVPIFPLVTYMPAFDGFVVQFGTVVFLH